jgi:tRNA nucleotidyltransferase/poly(A) polymerase
MHQLDEFINLLIENLNQDDRIRLSKKIKYGFRNYSLTLEIDEKQLNKRLSSIISYIDRLEIHFDNRNKCIEINNGEMETIIVEDVDLIKKWSDIFEEIINKDIDKKIKNKIESSLNKCENKSILRQFQMKKLFE